MNLRAVIYLLGMVLLLMAGFLLVPAIVGWHYGESHAMWSFVVAAAISAVAGGALSIPTRGSSVAKDGHPNFFRREGLAVVGLTWVIGGIVGALPFMFAGTLSSPIDAFFESASGFTTTGSTVMDGPTIDGMPKAIAFWRSFTHWLGGFGIVMVFVVLFPTGGRSLFRSEVPGIAREAGQQRVRDSAIALMRVYVGLSLIEFFLLWGVMHSWFDAAIHTFGTIATGGFSNHSESVLYFNSLPVEVIITVFMFMAGINFAVYDTLLRAGPRSFWKRLVGSAEIRAYFWMVVGASLFIAFALWMWGGSQGNPDVNLPDYRHFGQAVRDSSFLVVSLQTSTGYGSADFDRWPQICRVLMMVVALVGACAGSTGGGIKMVRIMIVFRAALEGVRRFVRPRAIHQVRIDDQPLDPGVVASVTGYFALWVAVFLAGTIFVAAFGIPPETSATAVIATLNNIGPGLGAVGPTLNFGTMPEAVKLVLTLFMILGRLEFYAVVALFVPGFWKK